ncbi:MAG: DsbA family protein [Gammaproteobacteria bacterium]|nr:DsbA family protein [Gammaproteobacteria bacterium]
MTTTLHYIADPLCGWCYGATQLISAAAEIPGLELKVYGGGLFAGPNRRVIGREMRDFIMQHDARMAALTGQPLGDEYLNGLLMTGDVVLDSVPPIRAVMAADAVAGAGLQMFKAIQSAHWMQGRRVAEIGVLREIAGEIGLDLAAFDAAWAAISDEQLMTHMNTARRLLARHHSSGFPTFVLETDGAEQQVDHQPFYGQPQRWVERVRAALAA